MTKCQGKSQVSQNMEYKPIERPRVEVNDRVSPITISEKKGKLEITIGEDYLNGVWASDNHDVRERLFAEIATIAVRGKTNLTSEDEVPIVKAIELIREIAPRDAIEALLASQMVAIHTAMIDMSHRVAKNQSLDAFKAYDNAMNRLARTYVAQVEALIRHRRKGTQKVVVQHVNVGEGGKAIVGDVNATRGGAV